jgi:UDP-N-acetylmuramoyl-L-alanyl-D-glutamate--2,6-diaminopimelate ligase
MAQIVSRLSDKVVLTSDNPRSEEPARILADMQKGVAPQDREKVTQIVDRRQGIKTALMLAGHGDIVLVAGKGHENYQEIKGVRNYFDDKEVIKELFREVH